MICNTVDFKANPTKTNQRKETQQIKSTHTSNIELTKNGFQKWIPKNSFKKWKTKMAEEMDNKWIKYLFYWLIY